MLEALLGNPAKKTGLPGPATLMAGNATAGYYGLTQSAEFITGSQLATLVGLSAGTLMNDTTTWMKFAYQGKVLYIPQKPIRQGLNWDAYNALDLVKPGALVTIQGHNFIVRHMTGGNADPATAAGGEWNALIYPVHSAVGTWAAYTSADLGIVAGTGGATYCQEVFSGSAPYHVYRGYSAYNYFFHDASNSTLSNYGWRPVLEYVGPDSIGYWGTVGATGAAQRFAHTLVAVPATKSLWTLSGNTASGRTSQSTSLTTLASASWNGYANSGTPSVNGATAVHINGKNYFFGGNDGTAAQNVLYEHTPSTNSFVVKAYGPSARSSHAACTDGTYMYVFGAAANNELWRYDPVANTWLQLTGAPTSPGSRYGCVMGHVAGKLYLFGGYSGSAALAELWVYNIAANTWTQKTSRPTATYYAVGDAYGKYLYVVSGLDASNVTTKVFWRYDTVADTWEKLDDLPETKYVAAGAIVDGYLVVHGGLVTYGQSTVVSNTVHKHKLAA